MTAVAEARLNPGPGETMEQRAIAATLTCIARHGISKTTIDDIARETGCSRATLYRYVGGRRELTKAAAHAEALRISLELQAAAARETTLEGAVVTIMVGAGLELRDHPALSFVVAVEPDRLLPELTFAGGDRFLEAASAAIAPALERFLGAESVRAGEWIARVGLALWCSPTAPVSLTNRDALRGYVRTFVLPAIDPTISPQLTSSPRG